MNLHERHYTFRLKISHYQVKAQYFSSYKHTQYNKFKISHPPYNPFTKQYIMFTPSSKFCTHMTH
jgi:hypothetical protein